MLFRVLIVGIAGNDDVGAPCDGLVGLGMLAAILIL